MDFNWLKQAKAKRPENMEKLWDAVTNVAIAAAGTYPGNAEAELDLEDALEALDAAREEVLG